MTFRRGSAPLACARCACVLFAMASGSAVWAQATAVVRGTIRDDATAAPIRAAEVTVSPPTRTATTDSLGRFVIVGVPQGPQIILVRRVGFAPRSAARRFSDGDTLDLDVTLVSNAQLLPEVDVHAPPNAGPKLAEFEHRRAEGFGLFITGEMLAADADRRLSDVLTRIGGPEIAYGATGQAWVYFERRGTATFARGGKSKLLPGDTLSGAKTRCYSAIVVDGSYAYTGQRGEPLFDVDRVLTKDVAALEFYRGAATMPPEYNSTRNTCGLLVIWTR